MQIEVAIVKAIAYGTRKLAVIRDSPRRHSVRCLTGFSPASASFYHDPDGSPTSVPSARPSCFSFLAFPRGSDDPVRVVFS